jgi:hypothetical protein
MKVAVWIDTSDRATMYETRDDLVSRIKARYRRENISMPVEQTGLSGQIQVANIDSDKLSPAAETKIDDPSEIDLGVDLAKLKQKQRESEEDISKEVGEAIQEAVGLDEEDGDESQSQNPNGKQATNTNGQGTTHEAKKDLVVGSDGSKQQSKAQGQNQSGDPPDPPDEDENEDSDN